VNRVRDIAAQVLRAPLSGRSWAELLYLLVSMPLAVLGVLYVLLCFVLGVGLAVTAVGIPLIAMAVPGARGLGSLRRSMARRLLGEQVPEPAPFDPPTGLLRRVSAGLRDNAGWRSVAYLLVALPLAGAAYCVVLLTWVQGLVALTFPIQFALGINLSTVHDSQGVAHRGIVIYGLVADNWLTAPLVCLGGVVLLLVAPWASRALLLVDRLLIRALLGPGGTAERIKDLERSRAYAIDDVAATLRRIERDLHDGVQARMVAVAMSLTMLDETLGKDISEQGSGLLRAARDHTQDAIVELRDMVSGIHPPALDDGLETALATLAARSPIPVALRAELSERPTEAIETIAYFSAAELLTNVTKHSGASQITVDVVLVSNRLRLRVCDNGHGGARLTGGSGLAGLTERVGTVDGNLAVASPPGGPTVITVELPLHT
jgi:signal transduction histidine kinase